MTVKEGGSDSAPADPNTEAVERVKARPDLEIDFRDKAERMHRRAQRAEGDLLQALALVERLRSAINAQRQRADTHRNARDKQRKRANRWQAEAERLNEARDPLHRIIAMGRRFSTARQALGASE